MGASARVPMTNIIRAVVLGCLLALFVVSNVSAQAESLKAKVYVRGEPQKWGQKMVVPDEWEAFVRKTRERLEIPADKYPSIRFYDIEDFEVQNIEEMTSNMHLFVELSGEPIPVGLRPDQVHTFPNPLLQQQMGLGEQQAGSSAPVQSTPQQGQAQAAAQANPAASDQQFGVASSSSDRGALLVSLPVQVLDNGKLRVEQVELYEKDDAEDVARVFCINHRIGDPECAKLLEALKQRRAAAVGGTGGGQQQEQQEQQEQKLAQQQQQQQQQQRMQEEQRIMAELQEQQKITQQQAQQQNQQK